MNKLLLIGMLSLAFVACDNSNDKKPNKSNYSGDYSKIDRNFNLENRGSNLSNFNMLTTPANFTETPADKELSLRIRQALLADHSLSPNAQNIIILSNNGVVILRGPVLNAAERDAIMSRVKSIQGIMKVDNQLEISK